MLNFYISKYFLKNFITFVFILWLFFITLIVNILIMNVIDLKNHILEGGSISKEQANFLYNTNDLNLLCDAADEICRHFSGNIIDSCSIVNARSGKCSEDCKWCAQASRHNTGCKTYNFLDEEEVMNAAEHNKKAGIRRFSLVTSGRAVTDKDLDVFCNMYRKLSVNTSLQLCASMGLLNENQMKRLKEAGVSRYHCNMETSSSVFPTLCSTHTPEDKRNTIKAARAAGLEVCSGGIIGMGETADDRIDFAFELAELGVDSVPVNILNPIKGTPLENTPLISEEEIIRTIAVWRFILPRTAIRFAGGRMRLSHDSMLRILKGGANGVLMGDMLTTVSNDIASDKLLFQEAGMEF